MHLKSIDLSPDVVRASLKYDPETGALTWLINAAKNVPAGSPAGTFKGARLNKKSGKYTQYLYVKLAGYDITAARLAWVLHYGNWPETNVTFADRDPANLRIGNLVLGRFPSVKVDHGGRRSHKMSREAMRHYGLRRYYGLTLEEYDAKLLAQNGVCAICEKPETVKMHGKVKPLSVDHSHAHGGIRDLLCASCNHLLGHAREDRNVLLAAVRYLDKHTDAANVVTLAVREHTE